MIGNRNVAVGTPGVVATDIAWDTPSHTEFLTSSPSSAPDSSFLLTHTLEGSHDGSRSWVPTTYVEDLDWISGSWLRSGPDPVVGMWQMNQQIRDLFLCQSLCLSNRKHGFNVANHTLSKWENFIDWCWSGHNPILSVPHYKLFQKCTFTKHLHQVSNFFCQPHNARG